MSLRVVEPKGKGALLLDSHPGGCRRLVERAATQVPDLHRGTGKPPRVLVVGASSGYGLALTVAGIAGLTASGIGLALERPGNARRTASAGWYRTVATADLAHDRGAAFEFVNGDCFDPATKDAVLDRFAAAHGQIDHLIYSVAAPRRTDPTGATYQSVIKPIGAGHSTYTVDFDSPAAAVRQVDVAPATDDETAATVKVMGGEDWADWVQEADRRGLLAPGAQTVALSYIGSDLTAPIYRHGTIGAAKSHLETTARTLTENILKPHGGTAFTSVNGAAVTQASTAIPGISLYVSLLHSQLGTAMQTPTVQATRLWQHLTGLVPLPLDDANRIRLDDWEFAPGVQDQVKHRWNETIAAGELPADAAAWFRGEVHRLYGFAVDGIDYTVPVELSHPWPTAAADSASA